MLVLSKVIWPLYWLHGWITGYLLVPLIIQHFNIQDLVAKYAVKLLSAVKFDHSMHTFILNFILFLVNIILKS